MPHTKCETPNATHQRRGTGHRPPDTKCGTPAPGTRRQKPEATYRLESHGVTHTRPRLVQTLELGRSLRDPARGVKANAQDNANAKAKAKPRPRAGPRAGPAAEPRHGSPGVFPSTLTVAAASRSRSRSHHPHALVHDLVHDLAALVASVASAGIAGFAFAIEITLNDSTTRRPGTVGMSGPVSVSGTTGAE